MGFLKSFFIVRGRLSPLQYWRFQVRLTLAAALVIVVTTFMTMIGGWLGAVPFTLMAPLIVSGACVCLRRLHDRGKGLMWLLLFSFGPFVLFGVGAPLGFADNLLLIATGFAIAAIVLAAWAWIEIGFLRGQKGPNRYGPDPRTAA